MKGLIFQAFVKTFQVYPTPFKAALNNSKFKNEHFVGLGVGNLKASTSSDNNFAKKEKSANSESEKTSSSSYDNFNKESDASLLSISEKLDKILKYQEESKIQLVQIKEYIEQGLELLKQSKIVDKTNV